MVVGVQGFACDRDGVNASARADCYNRIAMGYRLETDESVPKGLRRIVREEIESAEEYLGGKKSGGPDEAIHEAAPELSCCLLVAGLDSGHESFE